MTDLVGQTLLGKLRVVRRIGEGGMGSVYEVEHLITKHRRALKVLKPEVAFEAEVVTRFVREAGVAGTVHSPHLVETYDAGQLEDGSPYVLMELLSGEPLSTRIHKRKTLGAAEAAGIAYEVCAGIAAAHDAGIVHRDLKPDNVFLVRDDGGRETVKILDFGISKFAGTAAPAATDTGVVMGTPHYMAPEQAGGVKDLDARADVYAIGVMLYEMLSGERPFDAPTFAALIVRIHTGDHSPLVERAPNVDPELARVVERAMKVDRASRPANVRELQRALAPWVPGAGAHVPRTRESRDELGSAKTMIAADANVTSPPGDGRVASGRGPGLWIGLGMLAVGAVAIAIVAAGGGADETSSGRPEAREEQPIAVGEPHEPVPHGLDPPASTPDAGRAVAEPPEPETPRPPAKGTRAKRDGLVIDLGGGGR